MIDTILFDLDGTLLKVTKEDFMRVYMKELRKVFERLGMDVDGTTQALMVGTKAMVNNDGNKLNSERFWEKFADFLMLSDEQCKKVEEACDAFYSNEFQAVKTVVVFRTAFSL